MSDVEHDYEVAKGRAPARAEETSGERAPDPSPVPTNTAGKAAFGVHRAATRSQGAGPLDPEIAADIDAARAGGQPLDRPVRSEMESHLGADFSGVRVHTGSQADTLSRSVQADAFTTGSDIFFKGGNYAPETTAGKRTLAHELTHVVQQSTGAIGDESRVSDPGDAHEVEAKAVGDAVAAGAPATVAPAAAPTVSREEMGEEEEEEDLGAAVSRQEDEELEEEEAME